ncbi:MAG: ribonuclease [Polaromonas sp.]|nr:ribonuclease [Polaromonas sp.]
MPAPTPSPSNAWIIYCDGSARPNPGRIGIGAILIDPSGIRHTLSRVTNTKGCNNEAEVQALMAALAEAKNQGATELQIFSDSRILVEQLGPLPIKPIARLAVLLDEARDLLKLFKHAHLQWIPRHRNGEADALARSALNLPPAAKMEWGERCLPGATSSGAAPTPRAPPPAPEWSARCRP